MQCVVLSAMTQTVLKARRELLPQTSLDAGTIAEALDGVCGRIWTGTRGAPP